MSSSEIDAGNTYGSSTGYNNSNNNNNNVVASGTTALNESSTERTLRLKCTSEQGRYLAYLTIKHMVRTQGPHFQKGVSLGMNTWIGITRELNELGIEKSPEQWRKCYSAAKYFAHMRFMRMMREKQAATGNPNVRPDWNEIEIRDLLYLQDWRSKGFPDMPEPDVLMHAFENKQLYLHDYHPHSPKSNYGYQRDLFYDNNSSFCSSFNDFSQFPLPQQQQHQPQHEEVQIKCELDGSIDVDASEEFKQQLQQMVETQSRLEYGSTPRSSSHSIVTPPMPMPKPLPAPMPHTEHEHAHAMSTPASSMRTSNFNSVATSRCRIESVESAGEQPAAQSADGVVGPEHYYLERRLLEVSEKLLKEKVKQTKILRKKNRILKQTRKEQKKQTDTLNKLLEQLVKRT